MPNSAIVMDQGSRLTFDSTATSYYTTAPEPKICFKETCFNERELRRAVNHASMYEGESHTIIEAQPEPSHVAEYICGGNTALLILVAGYVLKKVVDAFVTATVTR